MACEVVRSAPEAEPDKPKPLSRAEILGAADIVVDGVDVPEWGGQVYIRAMSGAQRDKFETAVLGKDLDNIRARMVVLTACDATGQRLFTDADVAAVSDKSAAVLDRIFWASLSLNKMGHTDVDELKNG